MFYFSPWMLYGVILTTAYFILFLFGFGGKSKTKVSKPRRSLVPVASEVVVAEENQTERFDQDFEDAEGEKDSQLAEIKQQAQIREGTSPSQISRSFKSGDDFKLTPANTEENIKDESHVTEKKRDEIVQIQEACFLEFEGPVNFPTDHVNANRPEDENNFGFLESKLFETNKEESKIVHQRISNIASQESLHNIFDVREHESTNMQRDCHLVVAPSTSHESNRHVFVGNFAESLVTKAKSDAFSNIELECTASIFADKFSKEIIFDAIDEFVDTSHQRVQFPKVQELQRYAEDVVRSLIKDASGNVCLMRDMESFAVDLSEQVINEGIEQYVTNTKVEKVKKKKASLSEVKIFSECIANEVVSDGIDQAAEQENDADVNNDASKEEKEHSVLEEQDSTVEGCDIVRIPFISTSLKPHIGGVVENLVNGAICEAVSRIKTHMTSDKTLEFQVNNTVRDLMVSALNVAAVESRGQKMDDQATMPKITDSEVASDRAIRNAASQEGEEHPPTYKGNTSIENIVNGHIDHLEGSENVPNGCQATPQICIRSEDNKEINNGFDAVPDQAFSSSVAKVELREQKSCDGGDYWRRSLILDLEDDDELDDSFGSEKSPTTPEESLTTPKQKESFSDDESEEFIDSSEDEVIDHAEEAKLGAVGSSHIPEYDTNNKEMEYDDNDDYDDDDGDYDYEDEDDDEDSGEIFVPESMVDGLCVSKPKGKRKKQKKHKSLPRARIQSADSHFNNAVVIDNGCGCIKLGLAGDRNPRVVQPMVFGIPKRYSLQLAAVDNKKDKKYGDRAVLKAGVMQLEYPMSAGSVENWSDVEEIWEYMLTKELGIEEGNHPILITEVANNSRRNREKIAEILFEHLSVPAMYLANQLALSLYASGLTIGMCLSSGFSVSQAAAIYEGYVLAHTVQQLDIGGQSLTDNLQKLLRENKGLNFSSSSGWQIVNNMKERMTYVAADYSAELKQYNTNAGLTQFYTLPDGQTVDISSEMISTTEPLFAPETLLGVDDTVASQLPIHKLVNNAFKRCSPELQENIYRNVVLSGGTTLLSGLTPRLQRELSKINTRIRGLRTPENRRYSAWIGGSILSSLSSFDGMYVTVDEYADHGARVVNQKCF